jgi:hypothetical protein
MQGDESLAELCGIKAITIDISGISTFFSRNISSAEKCLTFVDYYDTSFFAILCHTDCWR